VVLADRGEPERRRVLLAADPEEAAVQQPHRAREHALAGEVVAAGQVALDTFAQRRQRAGETRHVLELLRVPAGAPRLVVAVLLAAGGVDARRLQMPVLIRTDPHVGPRGRDAERADARDDLGILDAHAVVVVREPAARLLAGDPGT
jgi:hypothetical protein